MIGRAAVLCAGDVILTEHLPPSLLASRPPPAAAAPALARPAAAPGAGDDLQGEIKSLERTRIVEALERCAGNQSKAAEMLGISRRTLVSRLSEFGLPRPRRPVERGYQQASPAGRPTSSRASLQSRSSSL